MIIRIGVEGRMFERGQTYSREQVQRLIGAPIAKGGDWATGYTEFNGSVYAFANIGAPGRTGHDYANSWDGDRLIWQSKNPARRGQPQVDGMLSGETPVHMFVRSGSRQLFVYAGIASAAHVSGDAPVTVEWEFAGGRPPEPLTVDELADELARLGFDIGPIGSKSQLLQKGDLLIYLKRDTRLSPLVLGPEWQEALDEILALRGVWRTDRDEFFYHQSMLLEFPSRRHTGKTDTHYGLDFELNSRGAVRDLIALLLQWRERPSAPISPGPEEPDPKTETEARRAARLGQGKFRDDLLARWKGSCALTGIELPEMIRASHIKPWRDSAPKERLDPDNGLPLLVHLDLLFDKGLISFAEDGAVMLSARWHPSQFQVFGVNLGMRIVGLSAGNREYLKHHRSQFFGED